MASHVDAVPRAGQSALYVARSPEGQASAERPAAAPSLTSEQAKQQAQAEGLTLRVAKSKTGYYGVPFDKRAKTKPYPAQVWRGGKQVTLGTFATAEEAALCIARSPEGQAAAKKAAAAPQRTSEESDSLEVEAAEAADVLAQIYTSSRKRNRDRRR